MERWWAWQLTLVALAAINLSPSHSQTAEFLSDTLINNVVVHPRTGRLYIGAVNALYQLNPDLKVESHTETGPKRDNRQCTPPVTEACEEARDTDNHNKLLLVHEAKDVLVVCGSVFRGICSLRNLSNVEQLLYFSDTKGEKSYVASAEEGVSVVGVMSYFTKDKDNFTVFVVSRYNTHRDCFASAVQANPFFLRYLHDFRFAFKDGGFMYFLFSRTLGVQDTKNFTFISRMCEDDQGYYSYTELQLNCSATNKYNKAQVMMMHRSAAGWAVRSFIKRAAASFLLLFSGAYPLRSVNKRLVEIIGACYSNNGIMNGKPAVYSPYSSKSEELCSTEFLPSPMASKAEFALTSEASLVRKGHMTAVAVAVEMGHAVAFLGTAAGEVTALFHSFILRPKRSMENRKQFKNGDVLPLTSTHAVVSAQITKVPVQACHLKTDCHACVSMKDPYCGWCVLEGKCTRKQECSRSTEENAWLWSPNQQCVQIQAFDPPNLSCRKTQQVRREAGSLRAAHKASLQPTRYQQQFQVCVFYSNQYFASLCLMKSERCPQFESPDPLLIPVGFETPISFQGRNLDIYAVIVLYNCSVGREDCSLCKHADAKYQCVWCAASRTCVYRELCHSPQPTQCPNPEITDIIPRFGPLNGNISVTIKGSNMGIKKEDIKRITVAGVECVHQQDRYSVSTRLATDNVGLRLIRFLFQDPKPKSVEPLKGPAAGGTVITIRGNDLDTATKDDVTVRVERHRPAVLLAVPERHPGHPVPEDSPAAGQHRGGSEGLRLPPQPQLQRARQERHHGDQHHHRDGERRPPSLLTSCQILVSERGDVHSVLFIRQGRGFSKAMTAKEAQAFVGDASCHVNILQDDKLILEAPSSQPRSRSKRQRRDTANDMLDLVVKFGHGEWLVGSVYYARKDDIPLAIIIPAVLVPMLLFIAVSVYCYRKSQQAEREYEKVKHQLENLEESVRDRCKKEFTDLMIEMEDHTSDLSEARIPFLDYKTYTDRNFFLPSKEGGANDTMITGRIQIPEARRMIVPQALNQFSNLLNSKTFLINFIHTLESRPDFNARARGDFASLLTVALHGKLEYYTDIMRTLLLELMEEHVQSKNPKLMLRRSETVVERMLCNWMSICLYQFLRDTAGEPLYKLFKALKHQVEKGPVDAKMKKAKYTLNDTGLLGDDVEYSVLTLQVLVHGEGPDVTPVKVLNCDTISQVKEKIIDQVYRNLPYSQRPKVESVALEWRPGSTGQILSDLDLTSQKEGRWKRLNTLAHYNVRDNATLVLSRVLHTQSFHQHQDNHEEKNALLEDDNTFHLVRPADEIDEVKSKRGSMKDKAMTKAITEIYLTRLLSVKGTLQQFVDDFFRSVLCSSSVVPPAVKYFFDFLDEQALRHDNVDEETLHIWKTNSLPLRFWVNILRNPHFVFDVHVTEVVDASLHVISQTFMDACTKTEHKLSRESPSNKLLYAKEISTYKKMVDDYYKGIRQMVPVSDQDMNTHLAEVSRQHTDKLNTQVALHQLYKYASKYYDVIIQSLDEDPAAQNKQLTLRLQQIAAALENKVTDL
uniref:Plexin-B2-like n=1 Tax=Echeneis naucrates TaxID=173247 RepID=A0A665UU56_ECHNA